MTPDPQAQGGPTGRSGVSERTAVAIGELVETAQAEGGIVAQPDGKGPPLREVEPGKFVSPLAAYPGHLRFPHPFLGAHYRAWSRAYDEPVKDGDAFDGSELMRAWRGALAILSEWDVQGLPRADLDPRGDRPPLEIQSWVRKAALRYIADRLNLKNWRAPSGTT